MVACQVCGKEFEAARRTAKFCGSGCRVKAHRAPGTTAPAAPAAAPAASSEEPAPQLPIPGGLYEATERELQAAGRTHTAGGQAALVLAGMLDNRSPLDGGSAIAAMIREHRNTLAAAVAGAQKSADPLDELAEQRNRRRAGTAPQL
jgi:hypothetical protein